MKIEAGKRYVRRDGQITEVMENHPSMSGYFVCYKRRGVARYRPDGRNIFSITGIERVDDIVSEYIATSETE